MPLPVALPALTGIAFRYGTVAVAAYVLSRKVRVGRRDQSEEDAHDHVEEGLSVRREEGQVNSTARVKRVFRFGKSGPAVEIDATGFARVRIRKPN